MAESDSTGQPPAFPSPIPQSPAPSPEARARKLKRLALIAEGLRSAAAACPNDPELQARVNAAGTACQQLVAHLRRQEQQQPVRRCDDCALHLGDVLRSLGSCPRWGMPRHGVESRCPSFVAKGVSRG